MTVYVDDMNAPFGRMKMCHMVADSEEELAEMAKKIGVPLKWWQHKGKRKSHFDICLSKKKLAIEHGAKAVTLHELGCLTFNRKNPNEPLNINGFKSDD